MGRKRKHFKNDEVFRAQLKIDDIYSISYENMNFVGKVISIEINPGALDYLILQCIMSTHLGWIDIGSKVTWSLHDDGEKITKL
jgi:hypothetical protein